MLARLIRCKCKWMRSRLLGTLGLTVLFNLLDKVIGRNCQCHVLVTVGVVFLGGDNVLLLKNERILKIGLRWCRPCR